MVDQTITLGRGWGVIQAKPLSRPALELKPWLNQELTMGPNSDLNRALWRKSNLRPQTDIRPGAKFGAWVLVKEVMPVYRVDHGKYRYRSRYVLARCECGTETHFELKYLYRRSMCRWCAQKLRRKKEQKT